MTTRRLTTGTLCRSIVLAGCVIAGPAAVGLAGSEGNGPAALLADASASAPIADAKSVETAPITAPDKRAISDAAPAEALQPAATDNGTVVVAAVAPTATEPGSVPATDSVASPAADSKAASEPSTLQEQPNASDQQEPVHTASISPTEMLETPPAQEADASPQDRTPVSTVSSVEVLDECYVIDACVDRYLWALYQRTPKEDSIKQSEQRAVTVKRKHRTVTVMKTFTRLVDEDFAWKDPKAADKAGMTMSDYVIGGMDRSFKLKLFRTLLAAEAAGLSPGITSAFRDDYRQSIATGLKAASDRSYHGGSFRGGYGHGLAADIVSVKGATRAQRWASTEIFWKWIDAHGKEFGIARPYLGRDPPHVGPIDGQEYASKRGGDSTRHVAADVKTAKRLAMRANHHQVKHAASARTSKASAMRSARNAPARMAGLHG